MTEPNAQTKRAARRAANEALAQARHNMDISLDDVRPDAAAWTELAERLTSLLASAYPRNHIQEQ